jgi:hypothetical protein
MAGWRCHSTNGFTCNRLGASNVLYLDARAESARRSNAYLRMYLEAMKVTDHSSFPWRSTSERQRSWPSLQFQSPIDYVQEDNHGKQ